MNKTFYFATLSSLLFIIFSIGYVVISNMSSAPILPKEVPPKVSYDSFIAGLGIIEPDSENVEIRSSLARRVISVNVKPGDFVKKGDLLIKLNDRDLQAKKRLAQLQIKLREIDHRKSEFFPREEDAAPLEAAVEVSKKRFEQSKKSLDLAQKLDDPRAISVEEMNRRLDSVAISQAQLNAATARLNQVKAGTWAPDLTIALYGVVQAKIELEAIEAQLELTEIRAPSDGQIFKVYIKEGELSSSASMNPLIIFGNTEQLKVRVDIDENLAWELQESGDATGYALGNRNITIPLKYEYTEPYLSSKGLYSGRGLERLDRRVIQIMYTVDKEALLKQEKKFKIYPGQLLDVFIKREEINNSNESLSKVEKKGDKNA